MNYMIHFIVSYLQKFIIITDYCCYLNLNLKMKVMIIKNNSFNCYFVLINLNFMKNLINFMIVIKIKLIAIIKIVITNYYY